MQTVATRNNILWSGENPIILLKESANQIETTAIGFFRVDFSPAGSGHAVFVVSDFGEPSSGRGNWFACYTDRPAVARWIRDTTIGTLPEFKNHDLSSIPIKSGRFGSMGDTQTSWTELVSTDDGEIRLTWSKLRHPFNLRVPTGAIETIPYEINTILYPADEAEVILDGRRAKGKVFPDIIGDQKHSTAFLALSETWYS